MNILLIHPSLRPERPHRNFPIGIAYVASAMQRAGYEFDILDIEAERHSEAELNAFFSQNRYDVVGIGTLVTGYKIVKELVAMVRRYNPKAVIVAGNSVASSIPEILLRNTEVNVGVIGEGDVTMLELLSAIKENRPLREVNGICFLDHNEVVFTPRREVIEDINSIPILNWDLFNMEIYTREAINDIPEPYPMPKEQLRPFVMNTARGCLFHCTFCYHVFHKDRYRYRSPESILTEIALLQDKFGINYVVFYDELTFFSHSQTENFVDKLLASGLKFYWMADVRGNLFTDKDLPLLTKMKQSGCVGLGYSLESGNIEILQSMQKKITPEDFINQKRALDQVGIRTFTSLVFGYPQETAETIKQTLDICYDLDLYPSAGFLLPQPNTPMYEKALEMDLIQDEEDYLLALGDRQDLRINLTQMPNAMLTAEVGKGLARIAQKLKLPLSADRLVKTGKKVGSQDAQPNAN